MGGCAVKLPSDGGGANVALSVEEVDEAIAFTDGIAVLVVDLFPSSSLGCARFNLAKLLNGCGAIPLATYKKPRRIGGAGADPCPHSPLVRLNPFGRCTSAK